MNSIRPLEYQQCRTCYDSTSNLQLLTSIAEASSCQDAEKTYVQLIYEVCNINVMDDKPLEKWPQFICSNCSNKLKMAHGFIEQTHKVNQLLKSIADLLELKNKSDFIELPELDISLDMKIENNEILETLPSERIFQYSPIESEIIKGESIIINYNKYENINYKENQNYNTITQDSQNTNEALIPSTNEFINDDPITWDDTEDLLVESINNIDSDNTHANATFTCSKCNKIFTTMYSLKRHERCTHLSNEKISCPLCLLTLSRSDYIRTHLQNVHKLSKSKTKIIIENMKKSTSSACYKKSTSIKDTETFTCKVCKKVFNSFKTFLRHKRLVHDVKKRNVTCNLCDREFKRTDLYKKHMESFHATNKVSHQNNIAKIKTQRFFCDKCDCSYTRRYRLYQHIGKVHGQ